MLEHERLADLLRHVIEHRAPQRVERASRRERQDHADRLPGRPRLGQRIDARGEQKQAGDNHFRSHRVLGRMGGETRFLYAISPETEEGAMKSLALIAGLVIASISAPGLEAREYLKSERAQQRGFTPGVVTEGGKVVWVSGQTGL